MISADNHVEAQNKQTYEGASPPFSSLLRRFMCLPLSERVAMSCRFLRGLWIGRSFDTKGFVDAGARISIIKRNAEIHLDRYCRIRDGVGIAVIGESPLQKAVLRIGFDSGIGEGTKINVTGSISIGNHCSIGWDCDIADTAWHHVLIPGQEPPPLMQPVTIEDNVWICSRVIVMRGVTIGSNSVISMGSVVATNIPPNSLAAGNPARILRRIGGWSRNPRASRLV